MAWQSSSVRRLAAVTSSVFLVVGGVPLVAETAAQALTATRYVSTTGDDSDNSCTDSTEPCLTIQYAVDQAGAGDTVRIGNGTYHESVQISTSLTLVGAGSTESGKTTIDGASGDSSGPSVDVDGTGAESPLTVAVRDLNVSGNQNDDGVDVEGTATVQISDSAVSNNSEEGVDVDGGAQATIDDSTIDDNDDGGVIVNSGTASITGTSLDGNAGAGLVLDSETATATLTTSTVSNTVPREGEEGGTYGGGVLVFPGGAVTIDTSTIFGNSGQGVLAQGAARVTIVNSTISGTVAHDSDDLPQSGIAQTTAESAARSATRAFNLKARSVPSARVINPNADVTSPVSLVGTIVADNTTLDDCNQDVTDNGDNLDSDGTCALNGTGSVSKGAAKLGALADNGGPTKTLLPAKGSDAIDAIPTGEANCSSTATDQRAVSRPQGATDRCDIGAVEVEQSPIVVTPAKLPHGTIGVAYHVKLSATGGLGAPYELSLAPGSKPLPHGITLSSSGVLAGTPTESGTFPFTVSVDDPTLQNYVLVIAAAASPTSTAPDGNGAAPIANTGARVGDLTSAGALAVLLGLLVLLAAGWVGRSPGRHRFAARRTR